MDAVTLLELARAAGLRLRAEGDRLIVQGPKRAEALVHELAERKAEVLELTWRIEAMRPQVPRRGPIPFLVARDVAPQAGCCLSCGDPLPEGRRYRCDPCQQAAELVLNELRG